MGLYDNSEQCSRRNCLLIHGVPGKQGESTENEALNFFNNNLTWTLDGTIICLLNISKKSVVQTTNDLNKILPCGKGQILLAMEVTD